LPLLACGAVFWKRCRRLEAKNLAGVFWVQLLTLLVFASAVDLRAQPIIGSGAVASSASTPPGGSRPGDPTSTTSSVPGAIGAQKDPAPFQWGVVEIRPKLSYRIVYGDGIQARPGNQQSSVIQTISPGLVIRVGDRWAIDYALNQTLYSQRDFSDTLDHAFGLKHNGALSLGSWEFQLQQNYAETSELLAETGSQTKQENVTTSLGTAHPISRYLSLTLGASQSLRFAGVLGKTFEWTTTDWLNYQQVKEFGAGVGYGAGYVDISKAPNSSFQRVLGRASWQLSPKTGLDFNGGLESRKSSAKGAAGKNDLIYNFSLHNAPFDYTKLSFSAGRTISISLFQNSVSDAKTMSLALNQRLLGKLQFSAQVEQQKTNFAPQGNSVAFARDDDKRSFSLGLSATFRKRGTIGVTYQHSTNKTNLAGFGFTSSQFGLQAAWAY